MWYAVVWNPWDKKAKSLPDLGDEDYKKMLCVDSAAVETPIVLKPSEEWKGRQELSTVSSSYCSGQLDPRKVLYGLAWSRSWWDWGAISTSLFLYTMRAVLLFHKHLFMFGLSVSGGLNLTLLDLFYKHIILAAGGSLTFCFFFQTVRYLVCFQLIIA